MSAGKTTFASHPGNIRANLFLYLRYFPGPAILPVAIAIAGLGCPFIFGTNAWWVALAAVLAALVKLGSLFQRVRLQFMHGCLNPAIVLQTKPLLLAVYTDLTLRDENSFPVIKILLHPKLARDQFKVGDRCATVSLYAGYLDELKWRDFDPKLVNVATRDPALIANSIARLPEPEWFLLQQFLPHVPSKPGLYPVSNVQPQT